eukprot:8451710-Pyramimonas_sp.AAC.1
MSLMRPTAPAGPTTPYEHVWALSPKSPMSPTRRMSPMSPRSHMSTVSPASTMSPMSPTGSRAV